MQQAMKADTEAAINAFGKNERVKKVSDPVHRDGRAGDGPGGGPGTVQQVVGMITGMGV